MTKILVLASEHGYWGEEMVGPLEAFDRQGYEVTFITPTGQKPRPLPPSMDPKYVDPPLGRSVTSKENAEKTRKLDESDRLDNPLDLSKLFPERPYMSSRDYLRRMERYYQEVEKAQEKTTKTYDALLIVGGSGPIVDLVNNQRVHDLILGFYKKNKLIAAECYGVACLAFARDIQDRKPIIQNKRVTGHCLEYDYHDGTGFLGTDFNMGPPPYPLEYILRDATAPDGQYIGNAGRVTSVIVDYPFITSRSTPDSYLCGEKMVDVLERDLTRYGW
jgi:putative intracellular protease/amidase